MRTSTKTATVQPTLHRAQETLTDTVLPTVRDAFATAREKGVEFLDSDVALEARRRGLAVVRAAKGEPALVAPKRWRFGLGMVVIGTGLGYAIAWLGRRLATPVESYSHTMPATPSGTVTSTPSTTMSTTTPATGATEDIDLRSGSPTNP